MEAGSQKLLFDVGRGASMNVVAYGVNLGAVTKVFLTHLHGDHLLGLPDFWLTGHLQPPIGGRSERLTVFGPEGLAEMISGLHEAYGGVARNWNMSTAIRMVTEEFEQEGVVYDSGGVRVTAFRVPLRHLLRHRSWRRECGRPTPADS